MDREWRIIDALHRDTAVPVPAPLAQCTDPAVTGAPFYVMPPRLKPLGTEFLQAST